MQRRKKIGDVRAVAVVRGPMSVGVRGSAWWAGGAREEGLERVRHHRGGGYSFGEAGRSVQLMTLMLRVSIGAAVHDGSEVSARVSISAVAAGVSINLIPDQDDPTTVAARVSIAVSS